jgi:hypothetical protein
MKFDTPPGSVFGGYGFWAYSATPDAPPSTGNGNLPAQAAVERSALSLRVLFEHARRMLRRTQD